MVVAAVVAAAAAVGGVAAEQRHFVDAQVSYQMHLSASVSKGECITQGNIKTLRDWKACNMMEWKGKVLH